MASWIKAIALAEVSTDDPQAIYGVVERALVTHLKSRDTPRSIFKYKQLNVLDIDEALDYKISPALHVDLYVMSWIALITDQI